MRWLDKTSAKLTIKFVEHPLKNSNKSKVTVAYQVNQPNLKQITNDFWKYAGKILFYAGSRPEGYELRALLTEKITNGLKKNDIIISKMIDVKEKGNANNPPVRVFKATFYKHSSPKVPMVREDELYYASQGVLAFLQYFIDSLSEENLKKFSDMLYSMLRQLDSKKGRQKGQDIPSKKRHVSAG